MARFRPPTLLESVFLVAAAAMAWFAVVPTLRKARETARIDLAARSLLDCDRAVHHLLRTREATNAQDITLAMILDDRRYAKQPAPVWPAGTDLESFVPSATNGCTIRVTLPSGATVLVSAASNRVDHAN